MNSIQLEYFLRVAQSGSFTAAARKLYISQPALSKQILALEEELETSLFLRLPHGVKLTPEGKKLMGRAEEISRIIKNIPAELHDLEHKISGELNIVCGNYLSRQIMPDLLKRLLQRYPGICPRIRETDSGKQASMLLNGMADIGIGIRNPANTRLLHHTIFHSNFVLIRSASSELASKKTISKEEIAHHPLVCYPQGSIFYAAVCRILQPYTPNIFMDTSYSTTIIELVRNNFGLAFVPEYLIEPDKRSGILIGGYETGEQIELCYHYSSERPLTPQAKAFIEVICEKFNLV